MRIQAATIPAHCTTPTKPQPCGRERRGAVWRHDPIGPWKATGSRALPAARWTGAALRGPLESQALPAQRPVALEPLEWRAAADCRRAAAADRQESDLLQ